MSTLMAGYIDGAGAFIIPPTLRVADPFQGEVARSIPYGTEDFGFLDRAGNWIAEPRLHFYRDWSDGICTFNVGGKSTDDGIDGGAWGWITATGSLLAPRFAAVGQPAEGLIPVQIGRRWGFADASGELRIEPRFERAGSFSAGAAVVTEGGRDGYLGADGSWLLPPQFEEAGALDRERGRIRKKRKWYFIDHGGRVVSKGFDDCLPFVGGMARVHRGEQVAFVNLDGEVLGGHWFDEANWALDGFAPVRRGDQWFWLDLEGRLHGPYALTMPTQGGVGRFVDDSGRTGFMHRSGKVVAPAVYERAFGFGGGFAGVERDGAWTFIDAEGAELHPPRWQAVGRFDGGLCPVRSGKRWGVIDAGGAPVVDPMFDRIAPFSAGRAAARRVTWPSAIAAPPPDWHLVPAGGLAHSGFADAGPGDELRVSLCYRDAPSGDALVRMQQVVRSWREVLEARAGADPIKEGSLWIAPYALSFRLTGVAEPGLAIELLLRELRGLDLPIMEAVFGIFRPDPDLPSQWEILLPGWMPARPHPDDPRGRTSFPTFAAYAKKAFDPRAKPPASENLQELVAGRWNPRTESLAYDERILSLHLPDVRICYGTTQEKVVDPDRRAKAIGRAVGRALAARFDRELLWVFPGVKDWAPPRPFTRAGDEGVEKLAAAGRTGYGFAIDCPPLLQDVGPDSFRYREPELFEALAGVVRAEELEPVIMWQRFGDPLDVPAHPGAPHPMQPTVYMINLWEKKT